MVSSKVITDPRLTDEELGLFLKILNNSDDYIFNSSYFQAQVSSQGERKYYKSLKHLQELGYIIKKPKLGGIDWVINEIPDNVIPNKSTDANNNASRLEDGVSTVPEVTNRETTTGKSTNREITSRENKVLTSNNRTSNNEINNNESINKGNNTNIIISNDDKLEDSSINSTDSKNKNTLSNVNVDNKDIQVKFKSIFQFDEELHIKLNTNSSGVDIVEFSVIEEYISMINDVLNSSNINKFEELTDIFNDITNLVAIEFDEKSFQEFYKRNYEKIPPNLITENNLILFQLYLNLDDFIFENEKKIKELGTVSTDNKLNKKKVKTDFNTTKIVDRRTNQPITQLLSEANVPKEKYEYFKHLIDKNKELRNEERTGNLLVILTEFKQYFKKEFGADMWTLIEQDKTIQIKLINDSGYSWKTIWLYQNGRDLYQDLIDAEISKETTI